MRRKIFIVILILTASATKVEEAPKRNKLRNRLVKAGLVACAGSYVAMKAWQYWNYSQTQIPIREACAIYNQNDAAAAQLQTAITMALPACCYNFDYICRNLKETIETLCTNASKIGEKCLGQWAMENKTEKCESCNEIKNFSKHLMPWYGHCLIGKSLRVDENGEQQDVVIKNIAYLSGQNDGGSRSAYDLKNGKVILLPNTGPYIWKRMVEEEDAIDKFYRQYIMTSGVRKATYKMNGQINYALVSKNFASYREQLGFVIDSKHVINIYLGDMYDREWLSKIIPEPNLKTWLDMMEPMIQQYARLIVDGVECPSGDTLNYFYAGEGSPYAKNGKPSVFLFGFDFSSKSYVRTVEGHKNSNCDMKDIEDSFQVTEILMEMKRKTKFSMSFTPESKDDASLVSEVAAKSKERLLTVIKDPKEHAWKN